MECGPRRAVLPARGAGSDELAWRPVTPGSLCKGGRHTARAMSQEYVEIAQHVFDALNRGDLPGAMKDTATDFVFDFSRSKSFERGVYAREDIPRFQEAFGGVWESVRWEPEEFIDAGDQLITPITSYNRGRDGIEVQTRAAWLWSFRDRRIARITFFQERREALEAAGLGD
jgi:ketosteroid isomerase-like protein